MISPRMMQTPMSARQARVLFAFYCVRNTLGVLAFCWVYSMVRGEAGPFPFILLGLAALYVAVAVFNGFKLWRLYQKRTAAEERRQEPPV